MSALCSNWVMLYLEFHTAESHAQLTCCISQTNMCNIVVLILVQAHFGHLLQQPCLTLFPSRLLSFPVVSTGKTSSNIIKGKYICSKGTVLRN